MLAAIFPACKCNSIFHSGFVDVLVECIIDTLFMDSDDVSKSRRSQRNKNSFLNEIVRKSRGIQQQAIVNHNKYQKYDLDWFKPRGRQVEIMDAVDTHDWVAVEAPSGSGKTTALLWKALNLIQQGKYRRLVFVRGVMEVGDDCIGYLKGSEEDKLSALDSTRWLFLDFMSKGKLECEEKAGNIVFKIPNFLLGATIQPDTIYFLNGVKLSAQ